MRYPKVQDRWYAILLVIAMAVVMIGVGAWPADASLVAVLYGDIMSLFAVLRGDYVQAVTDIAVPLPVLSHFVGGAVPEGNG